MQPHEQKALAHIAHELLRITEGGGPKTNEAIGPEMRQYSDVPTSEKQREPEVQRELNRLRRAHESVSQAAEDVWKRTSVALYPPRPEEADCGASIESCGSQLGGEIQQQALRAEAIASSLRYLAESLAL